MINLRLYNIENISETAKQFLDSTRGFKKFAFYGKMGAGKTTFIIALCKHLGAIDVINSPSFTIINEYRTSKGSIVYHFDFYRIKNEEEALNFGIEDYLLSDSWIFMEWFEKIPNLLPKNGNVVVLKLNKNGSRTLKLKQNLTTNKKNAMKQQNF